MSPALPPDATCTLPSASGAPREAHAYEVIVVGGGMSGLCAALAAARYGQRTALIQDRPVLGGNASSEVRMWICGAHGPHNKETGYLEEIQLANHRRNPTLRYSVWDTVLYGVARNEPLLDLFLNSAVCEVKMRDARHIAGVTAWHLTRQKWLDFTGAAFIDCSGDSILRLSGAPCRWGREANAATGEPLSREEADRSTMGNTILIQLRQIDPTEHTPFVAPSWALPVDESTFPRRAKNMKPTGHNFWWLELGGLEDTIDDADSLRDRLLALAYGVWAYIKNHPDGRGHGWELEWIGSLPGKRENVRYEGPHILTQQDIEAGGQFEDIIAHGGWTMDDHPPGGIEDEGEDTTHYPAPSPYGIPYRSLYSRTVTNLWFAGRNLSATHMAMSSTRVMATCATLGQAAGTAVALARAKDCDNHAVHASHLNALQRRLMDHDQWLPGCLRPIASASQPTHATYTASQGDPEVLRDGHDRPTDEASHLWSGKTGDWVEIRFFQSTRPERIRLTLDSQLHRTKQMPFSWPSKGHQRLMPPTMPRDFRIEALSNNRQWATVAKVRDNERRCVILDLATSLETTALRLILERAWGEKPDQPMGVFSFEAGALEASGPVNRTKFPAPHLRKHHSSAHA